MRQFTCTVTVLAVQSVRAAGFPRKQPELAGCAMITHRFAEDGALRLQLQSSTADMVPNESAVLDWIESRLPDATTIVGYQLPELLALLGARSDPQQHPAIGRLVAGAGHHRTDLTETGLFHRRRTLAAACRNASIPLLAPEPKLLKFLAPWQQRPMHDDLVNACAATWRLWVTTQVEEVGLNPAVQRVVTDMDAWLAECCRRDRNRKRGGHMMHRTE